MDKTSISCPWGDCPGLNHGPKSREHEGRFVHRISPTLHNNTAAAINSNSARDRAK